MVWGIGQVSKLALISTWHDSETESLCTCEVVGGEQFSV
jgi:hypothetical protein